MTSLIWILWIILTAVFLVKIRSEKYTTGFDKVQSLWYTYSEKFAGGICDDACGRQSQCGWLFRW